MVFGFGERKKKKKPVVPLKKQPTKVFKVESKPEDPNKKKVSRVKKSDKDQTGAKVVKKPKPKAVIERERQDPNTDIGRKRVINKKVSSTIKRKVKLEAGGIGGNVTPGEFKKIVRQSEEKGARFEQQLIAKKQAGESIPEGETPKLEFTKDEQPLKTDEELEQENPARGFENVVDVLKIALNPFSKDSIVSNTDNRVFNTAAEYVANNPYMTATILTGNVAAGGLKTSVQQTGKLTVGKLLPKGGKNLVQTTLSGSPAFKVNTKTAKLTGSMLSGIAATLKKPAYVVGAVGAMIGTYPWAEWALGEAKEGMIFNTSRAVNTGNPEIIAEFQRQSDDIFDINYFEQAARLIPGANIAFGFSQKAKSLMAQKAVNDAILQDNVIKLANGESEGEKWNRIELDFNNKFVSITKFYEGQNQVIDVFERAAITGQSSIANEQGLTARGRSEAAFWRSEKRKLKNKEADDLKAIEDFYFEYKKTALRMQELTKISNNNFGG